MSKLPNSSVDKFDYCVLKETGVKWNSMDTLRIDRFYPNNSAYDYFDKEGVACPPGLSRIQFTELTKIVKVMNQLLYESETPSLRQTRHLQDFIAPFMNDESGDSLGRQYIDGMEAQNESLKERVAKLEKEINEWKILAGVYVFLSHRDGFYARGVIDLAEKGPRNLLDDQSPDDLRRVIELYNHEASEKICIDFI